MLSNKKNSAHLNDLKQLDRLHYMASGRVTVAKVKQFIDNEVVTRYAPKVRGIIVGTTLYSTPGEARKWGEMMKKKWADKIEGLKGG